MEGKEIMRSIVTVMSVIILVVVSALIVATLTGSFTFDDVTTAGTNTNETLSAVDNVTATDFAILSTYPSATCTLGTVLNSTDGVIISSGNYTQPTTCQILATTDSGFIGVDWNVTYDYSNTETDVGIINVTWVSLQFGLFVTALLGFISVIGVIVAIIWLVMYLKKLFSNEEGIQNFGGN